MKRVWVIVVLLLVASSCGWTDDKREQADEPLADSPSTTAGSQDGGGASSGGGAAAGRNCLQSEFPVWLTGRSRSIDDATVDGLYIWSDEFGVRIRAKGTTEPPTVFEIVVIADTPIKASKPRPEGLAVTGDSNRLETALQATPVPQGFEFDTCKVGRFSVSVKVNGEPWPTEALFVGRSGTAFGNPVDVART